MKAHHELWVSAVAVSCVVSCFPAMAADAPRLELSPETRPSPRRAAQKLRQRLWRAWSELSLRQRFVLALSDPHRLSTSELGEVLGEPEPAARRVRDEAKVALVAELSRSRRERRRQRRHRASEEGP